MAKSFCRNATTFDFMIDNGSYSQFFKVNEACVVSPLV